MEYLWRILTYGKMPPMRRVDSTQPEALLV
jgi:uncharacterized membrane protein YeiB